MLQIQIGHRGELVRRHVDGEVAGGVLPRGVERLQLGQGQLDGLSLGHRAHVPRAVIDHITEVERGLLKGAAQLGRSVVDAHRRAEVEHSLVKGDGASLEALDIVDRILQIRAQIIDVHRDRRIVGAVQTGVLDGEVVGVAVGVVGHLHVLARALGAHIRPHVLVLGHRPAHVGGEGAEGHGGVVLQVVAAVALLARAAGQLHVGAVNRGGGEGVHVGAHVAVGVGATVEVHHWAIAGGELFIHAAEADAHHLHRRLLRSAVRKRAVHEAVGGDFQRHGAIGGQGEHGAVGEGMGASGSGHRLNDALDVVGAVRADVTFRLHDGGGGVVGVEDVHRGHRAVIVVPAGLLASHVVVDVVDGRTSIGEAGDDHRAGNETAPRVASAIVLLGRTIHDDVHAEALHLVL